MASDCTVFSTQRTPQGETRTIISEIKTAHSYCAIQMVLYGTCCLYIRTTRYVLPRAGGTGGLDLAFNPPDLQQAAEELHACISQHDLHGSTPPALHHSWAERTRRNYCLRPARAYGKHFLE